MIGVAIIGAGIGAEHLEGFRMLPDRFAVRAVCDLDLERAEALVGGDPNIAILDTLEAALTLPHVDLVDVCLPPHLHLSASEAALAAGKHVVCEKPLARSLAEVDALIASSKAAGRHVFPVFQYRYGYAIRQINALQQAGLAGKPYAASLETHWNRDGAYYASPWRGTWAGESGGAVLGHAIHNHDLLMHTLGPVSALTAMATTRVNDIETEDCAAISLHMECGALATSSITLGASDDTTRIRLCFEGFTAESGEEPYAPARDPWKFTARAPIQQSEIDAVLETVTPGLSGYAGYFEAIADALEGQPGREVTLEDGRRSIELVSAIYLSARSGTHVALPLEQSTPLYASLAP